MIYSHSKLYLLPCNNINYILQMHKTLVDKPSSGTFEISCKGSQIYLFREQKQKNICITVSHMFLDLHSSDILSSERVIVIYQNFNHLQTTSQRSLVNFAI